jgi:hypothetical protein
MGRFGHPLQEQLAEKLEALFAEPKAAQPMPDEYEAWAEQAKGDPELAATVAPMLEAARRDVTTGKPKRGPGRPPKAKAD